MLEVVPYHVGEEFETDVWAATKNVISRMAKLAKKKPEQVARFRALLKRAATVGFDNTADGVVRHEGDQVYVIGDRHGPLLRAAGFYSATGKQTFLLFEFFEKTGQELTPPQRGMLQGIAKIREEMAWRFQDGDE